MACDGFVFKPTEITFLITEYSEKRMLSKMGYRFDPSTLEQWEVQAYSVISDAISEWESKKLKSKRKG